MQAIGLMVLCLSSGVNASAGQLAQILAQPLEEVMTLGGDDRIIIPAGAAVNKYFTRPLHYPGMIERSSSTSSSTSLKGFEAASDLFNYFRFEQESGSAEACFKNSMCCIRDSIKHLWGPQRINRCLVFTTPSGSDAEMLPTFAALARHPSFFIDGHDEPLVTNIVIASGEVGSGTALAAGLKHFSSLVPSGNSVESGASIVGIADNLVDVVELKIRSDLGDLIRADLLEDHIASILQKVIEQEGQMGVLHMVHACKTGFGAPRENFVRAMKNRYKDKLVVVVDAAQLRMDESVVERWLDQNFWVLLTGSKFLGGPSFSAALLIPEDEAVLLAQVPVEKIPVGLGDYFTPSDCDEGFDNFKQALPVWYNVGLALRWQAALAQAGRFYLINQSARDRALEFWSFHVGEIIRDFSPRLILLEDIVDDDADQLSFAESVGKINSITSFFVSVKDERGVDTCLNMAELRKFHKLMTLDLQPFLPALTIKQRDIAKTACVIGQPVQVATTGKYQAVLRLAISVPELIKIINLKNFNTFVSTLEILRDDVLIIKKARLIADNWSVLRSV